MDDAKINSISTTDDTQAVLLTEIVKLLKQVVENTRKV